MLNLDKTKQLAVEWLILLVLGDKADKKVNSFVELSFGGRRVFRCGSNPTLFTPLVEFVAHRATSRCYDLCD
jgi:hypothetical protein